ncbi:MAG: hypothetical protein IJX00_01985 [Clostridia bacterium]|nr:hypothetical protein [Clostridia bacterium]
MAKILIGHYSLHHPLLCDSRVLGKEIEIKVAGRKGTICFPIVKPHISKDGYILTCPIENEDWLNTPLNDGSTEWGKVVSYCLKPDNTPDCIAYVSSIILKFNNTSNPQLIFDNISDWFERFYKIKELLTHSSRFHSANELSCNTPPLDLFYYKNNKLSKIQNSTTSIISIQSEILHEGISFDLYNDIADLTNKHKDISFEYQQYLNALHAFDKKNYSMVIVECAVAIEKALSSGIEKTCKKKHLSYKKLHEKYKMLGGLFALAEALSMKLPTADYSTNIKDLRNNVVHQGVKPTKQQAKKFLDDTNKYLNAYCKLLQS